VRLPPDLSDTPIVLLTGAGASIPLGLPATREFLTNFRDAANARLVANDPPGFLNFIQERLSAVHDDIEVVLGQLEQHSQWLDHLLDDPTFVPDVLGGNIASITSFKTMSDQLRSAIYDEVIRTYGNVDPVKAANLYRGILGQYMTYFREFCGGRLTRPFFTLNYDTAIEEAAHQLGLRLVDGIGPRPNRPGRCWSSSHFTEYRADGDRLNVVLVKLHGLVRLARRETIDGAVFEEVPTDLERDPPPLRHAVLYPSLLPKPVTTEPFRTGYRMLGACLGNTNTLCLIVIGCSFRDAELNSLLRDSLDDNDALRIVVVDPGLDHDIVAQRIVCDAARIGVQQQRFDPQPLLLEAGQNPFLNALRLWVGAAVGAYESPNRFGTTLTSPPAG
jgi:hypothetical protein